MLKLIYYLNNQGKMGKMEANLNDFTFTYVLPFVKNQKAKLTFSNKYSARYLTF